MNRKHRKKKEELNNSNHLYELRDLEIKNITQEPLQVTTLSTSQSIKTATYIHGTKLIIATSTTWRPSKSALQSSNGMSDKLIPSFPSETEGFGIQHACSLRGLDTSSKLL